MKLIHNNNTHIIFGCFSVLILILYKIVINKYSDSGNDKEKNDFKYLILILLFSFVSEMFVFFVVYNNYKLINMEDIINTHIINFKNYISVDERIKKFVYFKKQIIFFLVI